MLKNYFSLFDVAGILIVFVLAAGIVFPSILASRETARRKACMYQLQQLGTAIQQHHEVHGALPKHRTGPGAANRISAFTFLLPYTGYQNLYEEITAQNWQVAWNKTKVDAQGKPVKDADGKNLPGPYCTSIPLFLCPEDSAAQSKKIDETGFNNYVFSHGDWITNQNEQFSRGPFVPEKTLTFKDILDGLSQTLAMSERSIASRKYQAAQPANSVLPEYDGVVKVQGNIIFSPDDQDSSEPDKPSFERCFQKTTGNFVNTPEKWKIDRARSGTRWADGQHFFTVMNTILPPNSASCMLVDDDRKPIVAPPTSYHTTGVNVLLLDGAVRFVLNTVDYGGNFSGKLCVKEGTSPFGVWGAMGNIADTKIPASP